MRRLAIIDIDGTINDFNKVDNEIISSIYGKNKIIKVLDRLLWKINSLDIITNQFIIFKARIYLYSLINRTKYKNDMELYKEEYVRKSKLYFQQFMDNEYTVLKKSGIEVMLLTCDPFDGFCENNVTVVQNKWQYIRDNAYNKYGKLYVVGNNYMDDISSGLKLRSKMSVCDDVQIYYVGNSKILKKLLAKKGVQICSNLKEVVNNISKRDIS